METDKNTMNELEKEVPQVPEPKANAETASPEAQPAGVTAMESSIQPESPIADPQQPGTNGALPSQPEPPAEVKAKKTFLRDSRSWTDIIPIAAMLSLLVLELGALLSTILMNRFIPVYRIGLSLLDDIDSVDFLLQYFSFFGIWIFFLLVALVFKDNWPMLKAFFYNRHGNNLKSIPAGILLGFGMNGFCVLMSCIWGTSNSPLAVLIR